uniref:Major royal jelly protein n=1 Tax=Solibacter usitatus (strain Ellin6076) TaxID=234267 RepID=Q022W0_SOLUE
MSPGAVLITLALGAAAGAADLEVVHQFQGPMPTGVTVSRAGRIFVNFPRWGDPVDFTVGEIQNGRVVPYPDADINQADASKQSDRFLSVQSVVVDPKDRLWVVDTGSIQFSKVSYGGPKLVGIDLQTNRVFKKILFPAEVAIPETYLNDVRFDLSRGSEGFAYLTDSGEKSTNGIIVVDLASGKSWRRLANHPSVKPDPAFVPVVEGQEVWNVAPSGRKSKWAMGSDGIAIDPARGLLYYCPLSSRHLFSVSLDALSDQQKSDPDVARTVADLGDKGGASDGLESDESGRVYASDYEHNLIRRRDVDGKWQTIAQDPRMLWPDTLSLSGGHLYFTCNQLHRQKQFHDGKDLRQKPYYLFRIPTDGKRISSSAPLR